MTSAFTIPVGRIIPVLALASVACGAGSDLWVTSKDFQTIGPNQQVQITVKFNQPADPVTVVSGTSLVLAGATGSPAGETHTWTNSQTLVVTSTGSWSQVNGPGGTDAGATLTLKGTIKSQAGGSLQQCAKGKYDGTEPLGDCKLSIVIPG